ncbi:MAG: GerW family sporulation protein [Butyrivibrio sp.]|nr:GerW family sporulation protein [Butyrivibrio sp.]
MAENSITGVVDTLMKGMNSILSTKTVVGDAVTVGDTIIVPLMDVSLGVGAGGSSADKKDGGAGGFGAKMSPSAVLIIKNGTTKLVNIKNQDAVTKVLDMVPDVMDKFMAKNEKMMDDDEAIDIAFPEE